MAEQPCRDELARTFLAENGLGGIVPQPLAQDASARRYFRLPGMGLLLMDAPPPGEKPEAFVRVTKVLQRLGARVPRIVAADASAGFILLEDLGQDTFARLLARGESEGPLYQSALNALLQIQREFPGHADDVSLPPYDSDVTLDEACLFAEWYLPARLGHALATSQQTEFRDLWRNLFQSLPPLADVLVHRDFHVDNLLLVKGQCAMLDYQDALAGSPVYDLVSLLEDARRDVNPILVGNLIAMWRKNFPIEQEVFDRHYQFWAAQRHCKVAGIFVRLWLRDGKPGYIAHLDRVMRLLARHLSPSSPLDPLKDWILGHMNALDHQPFTGEASKLISCCRADDSLR